MTERIGWVLSNGRAILVSCPRCGCRARLFRLHNQHDCEVVLLHRCRVVCDSSCHEDRDIILSVRAAKVGVVLLYKDSRVVRMWETPFFERVCTN